MVLAGVAIAATRMRDSDAVSAPGEPAVAAPVVAPAVAAPVDAGAPPDVAAIEIPVPAVDVPAPSKRTRPRVKRTPTPKPRHEETLD